jgi:hypothetical protein
MQHNQFITMQHSPHGVELQWQARERVAGDGAATALSRDIHRMHIFVSIKTEESRTYTECTFL